MLKLRQSLPVKKRRLCLEVLINIIPSNPVAAMANGEMLSIILFAILVGVSLLMVGKKAKSLVERR